MKAVFLCDVPDNPVRVYSEQTICELKKLTGLENTVYSKQEVLEKKDLFRDTEYVFSTWAMPEFNEAQIKEIFPSLKCIFYAAGTVQYFARPFLDCGVKVFSAWAANAVPVAEYTLAQIILANKGFFSLARYQSSGETKKAEEEKQKYMGNFGESVGIIGVGMIGSLVCEMLKNYNLKVLAFDPFLSEEKAKELGIQLCSLDDIFKRCSVVSNHLANNKQTQGMLKKEHFSSMCPYSTFINTGRGAQVVEEDLAEVLSKREDITAVLDVTYPEPPEKGHLFYSLPNCILTPHIAGSSGNEVYRMAEFMLDEVESYLSGKTCKYEVTLKMLETMA